MVPNHFFSTWKELDPIVKREKTLSGWNDDFHKGDQPWKWKDVAKLQKHAEDVCVGLAGAPPNPFISSVRAFMVSANGCGGWWRQWILADLCMCAGICKHKCWRALVWLRQWTTYIYKNINPSWGGTSDHTRRCRLSNFCTSIELFDNTSCMIWILNFEQSKAKQDSGSWVGEHVMCSSSTVLLLSLDLLHKEP